MMSLKCALKLTGALLCLTTPLITGCGESVQKSSTVQIQMAIYTPICLEVTDASKAEGQTVETYPCDATKRRQEWTFVPIAGTTNAYHIVNANSLQCMSVSYGRSAPGTPVIQVPCYMPEQPYQSWTYLPAPAPLTGYTLVSAVNGLCLDIPYGETTGSAPMQVFTCKGDDPAQAYILKPVVQASAP